MTGSEENKINCFPKDQSLSDLLYSWKFWSWKFIKPRCHGGRRSTFEGNSALLPFDVIDFAMLTLLAQRFCRETFSLLDVMWPRSNQWERAGKKNSSYITMINKHHIHAFWITMFLIIKISTNVPRLHPVTSTALVWTYSVLFFAYVSPDLIATEEIARVRYRYKENYPPKLVHWW